MKTKNSKRLVARAKAHHDADRFIQGFGYWKRINSTRSYAEIGEYRGCHIGCLATPVTKMKEFPKRTKDDCVESLEREFGLTRDVLDIAEEVFEAMEPGDAQRWPLRFAKALRDGRDLTGISYDFAIQHWGGARRQGTKLLQEMRNAPKFSS